MKFIVDKSLCDSSKVFIGIEADKFLKLCDEFEKLPVKMFLFDQITSVIDSVGLPEDQLNELRGFIFNIFFMLFACAEEPEHMAETCAIQAERFGFTQSERDVLKSRLSKLLSIRSLFLSIKSRTLFNDNEKILIGSKILTDLRPVFSNGNDDEIRGYIVIHNLKLVFEDTIGTKEFVVTFSSDELNALEAALARARRKAKVIASSSALPGQLIEDDL